MTDDIHLIIFDLDGTLVDAYPAIIASFRHAMKTVGASQQGEQTIRKAVGWGDKQLIRPFVPPEKFDKAIGAYRRHHTRVLTQKTRLYPKARHVLRTLKRRGYRLAVASNRPTKYSRILCRHLDILKYFDYVLCGDRVKRAKPAPDIMRAILKRFHLKPAQALYVGDMHIDIKAGRNAGIKTVVVTTGSCSRKELEAMRPYKVVAKIEDLIKIVGNKTHKRVKSQRNRL